MINDLASLVAPLPVQTFRRHFLDKTRLHLKTAEPRRAEALLPWSTINRLVEADGLPDSRLKISRAGNTIAAPMYRFAEPRNRLRFGRMQDLLLQGASLVMSGIDDFVPAIGRLTRMLESELACRVWCNTYLSFGAGSAFRAHYDLHDVIILQVHGRKVWRSHGIAAPSPVERHSRQVKHGDVVWEGLLEPGDVLYLPRGEVHAADLEGENSVHLTIGMKAPRGLDLVESFAKTATENALFRRDIPRVGGADSLAEHEAALKDALHAMVDAISLAEFLDRDDRDRELRPSINLGILGSISSDTVVVPSVRRRFGLDTRSEGVVSVPIGDDTFALSAAARRILAFLMQRADCVFADLVAALSPDLTEAAVLAGVSELAKHCLVGIEP